MTNNRPSLVWRLWLLIAQVVAVSAGLLIGWKAFGPEPAAPVRTDVVALREAPHADTSPSTPADKAVMTRLEGGFRAAAAKASATAGMSRVGATQPPCPTTSASNIISAHIAASGAPSAQR